MLKPAQKRLLILSSLGGVLEFYDFIIFALLAKYIAYNYFPSQNDAVSLIETFATFALGYLARPFGGILFGHFGDKRGRKKTFTASILLMALATFGIAFVPSYHDIGIAAPITITLLRLIQGLSIGGEIPGAIAYVSESIPEHKGAATGIIFAFLQLGILLGLLTQGILTTVFSPDTMLLYGWRIAFIIGGLFGLASFFLRQHLEESPAFRKIEHQLENIPLFTLLRQHPREALGATLVVGLGAAFITLLFLFTPAYISNLLHIQDARYIWLNAGAIFLVGILNIIIGRYADKFSHIKLLKIVALFTLVFALPIFYIYVMHYEQVIVALLLSALLTGAAWGIIPALLSDIFATKIRYSGIAVTYNLSFAIFGGLTPLTASYLIYQTHTLMAPAFYLIFVTILCFIGLRLLHIKPKSKTRKK